MYQTIHGLELGTQKWHWRNGQQWQRNEDMIYVLAIYIYIHIILDRTQNLTFYNIIPYLYLSIYKLYKLYKHIQTIYMHIGPYLYSHYICTLVQHHHGSAWGRRWLDSSAAQLVVPPGSDGLRPGHGQHRLMLRSWGEWSKIWCFCLI